jgi:CMP-N-acetylneuraminic acid synthetase
MINKLKNQDVYIDTDSKQILSECKSLEWITAYPRKQQFIDFEENNTKNLSPVLMMIDNFLDLYVEDENELIITPHVTSPFLKMDTILNACNKMAEGYDSVHSVTKHHEFSWLGKNKTPINYIPNVVQKTQDLDPIIMSNGGFFIFTKKTFKETNNRIGNNPYFYTLSTPEQIEIDNYDDLKLATLVYKGITCN